MKNPQLSAPFAPLRVLHPIHPVVGGIVIVATKTRTGHGVHLSTVSTGDIDMDRRLFLHVLQLVASGNFLARVRTALRILRGMPLGNPDPAEEEEGDSN